MADQYRSGFINAWKRYRKKQAASSLQIFEEIFKLIGDAIAKTGKVGIRALDIVGTGRKELFKFGINLSHRRKHTEDNCSDLEKKFQLPLMFLVGGTVGKKTDDADKLNDPLNYKWYMPGLLTFLLAVPEYLAKIPFVILVGIGEAIKTAGRFIGLKVDRIHGSIALDQKEELLRKTLKKVTDETSKVFADIEPNYDVKSHHTGILVLAVLAKLGGAALASPGRLLELYGSTLSKVNMLIGRAIDLVSNWLGVPLWDYSKKLLDAANNTLGAKSAAMTGAGYLVGAIAGVILGVTMLAKLFNNNFIAIFPFLIKVAGKIAKRLGVLLAHVGQSECAADPRQAIFRVKYDMNVNGDIEFSKDTFSRDNYNFHDDDIIDPDKTSAVKGFLYETFARGASLERRALRKAHYETRARFNWAANKENAALAGVPEVAMEYAAGVVAKEVSPHVRGFGAESSIASSYTRQLKGGTKPDEVRGLINNDDPLEAKIKENGFRDVDFRCPALGIFDGMMSDHNVKYWHKRGLFAKILIESKQGLDETQERTLQIRRDDKFGADEFKRIDVREPNKFKRFCIST